MWQSVIQEILDSGMTQVEISEALRERHETKVNQSYISQLYRGEIKAPNWELGNAIIALRDEITAKKVA